MLSKIKEFVKENQDDIILFIGVILIFLLAFALGFIFAKIEEKEPIKIEYYEENTLSYSFISRRQ